VAVVRHDQIFARDDDKQYIAGTDWDELNKTADIIDDVAMELGQPYRSTTIIGSKDESLPVARDGVEGSAGNEGAAHFSGECGWRGNFYP
jgi:hypothetical protein